MDVTSWLCISWCHFLGDIQPQLDQMLQNADVYFIVILDMECFRRLLKSYPFFLCLLDLTPYLYPKEKVRQPPLFCSILNVSPSTI